MTPIMTVVVAGLAGGLAMAMWLLRFNRKRSNSPLDTGWSQDGPTDVINMAHIRVAGVGGLGLVLLAVAVAFGIPQIGKSMAAGLVLGALLAVVLILRRQATGPMPSSGQRPGANTALAIDAPDATSSAVESKDHLDVRLSAVRT